VRSERRRAAIATLALAWRLLAFAEGSVERSGPEVPRLPFTDVTREAGIDFVHRNGADGEKLLPETMGGGVAFFDYDGDGDPDLLLMHTSTAADPPVVLYANDGEGRFRDVTAASGLAAAVGKGFLGMGVAAADVDGDGWRDLYLTAVGRNRLLRNRGGRFEDATGASGAAGPADAWSTGAAFFDADGDGDLDLFVANYVRWSREIDLALGFELDGVGRAYALPQSYGGSHSMLFLNGGDGRFEEVGAAAGIRVTDVAGKPLGKGMAVAVVDLDGDRRPDVFVANDTERNFLFHNLGGGRFEEVGEVYGLAYSPDGRNTGAMGVDHGEMDGGRLTLTVGNFAKESSSFYRASEDPTFFEDQALAAGVGPATRMALTFGVLLFDVDLDGRLDLLQANGHVEPDIAKADRAQSYRQAPQLFWNAGPARGGVSRFRELPAGHVGDLGEPLAARGAAYADVDGDGDLDLVLTQIAGPALLLRNDQESGHRWLRIALEGRPPNRDAIGAETRLVVGGEENRRTLQPNRGYLSQVEHTLTFGLGTASKIDALEVTWPDGGKQRLETPAATPGRVLHLRQPEPPPTPDRTDPQRGQPIPEPGAAPPPAGTATNAETQEIRPTRLAHRGHRQDRSGPVPPETRPGAEPPGDRGLCACEATLRRQDPRPDRTFEPLPLPGRPRRRRPAGQVHELRALAVGHGPEHRARTAWSLVRPHRVVAGERPR